MSGNATGGGRGAGAGGGTKVTFCCGAGMDWKVMFCCGAGMVWMVTFGIGAVCVIERDDDMRGNVPKFPNLEPGNIPMALPPLCSRMRKILFLVSSQLGPIRSTKILPDIESSIASRRPTS